MSKKINDLSALGGVVFSTNENFEINNEDQEIETWSPNEQKLEAHLDRKNRAGKTATIIKCFHGSESDFKALTKELKTLCGVGGTHKEGDIIIQGNFRDKIIIFLQSKGYKIKRVGG
jgi:translation initiation factor 1